MYDLCFAQELYEEILKNKFKFIGLSEVWNVKDKGQFKIPDIKIT